MDFSGWPEYIPLFLCYLKNPFQFCSYRDSAFHVYAKLDVFEQFGLVGIVKTEEKLIVSKSKIFFCCMQEHLYNRPLPQLSHIQITAKPARTVRWTFFL